jgi:beta-galactosidase
MEQTTSRVNWREVNVPKAQGQMRLWSLQAVARGADGVMFFQWRQSRAGAEKHHSAMVGHGPVEKSRVWRDVVRLGHELANLEPVVGSTSNASVAILFDWESWWALELPSKPSNRVRQMEQVEAFYEPLFETNVAVDFARPGDDLSRYRLVIAPSLYMVSDEAAQGLARFVEAGGTLVMSFFSGIVDPSEHIRLGGYPAPFREVLGLEVIDFHPLADGESIALTLPDGAQGRGEVWSEEVELHGAETIVAPAVTRHGFGSGTAFYLSTQPDPKTMARVLEMARDAAGVEPVAQLPQGVEAVRRSGRGKSFLFLLNHRDAAVDVPIQQAGANLVDGAEVHPGLLHLEPRGVAVIREGW